MPATVSFLMEILAVFTAVSILVGFAAVAAGAAITKAKTAIGAWKSNGQN